ncbi:ImmA/IrrE family metallo-endopeptidase [Rhizobium sp. BR 249]|uniref:ImmA/IrrE family metallo-endopeptidase n=1 Tax=Rhizobium sp. BR 249 TaxID=3040011 RepID=UPI0039BF7A0B
MSKSAVDKLAANVAKQVGYTPGADLLPIVRQLGGEIGINDLWSVSDATSGSITIEENGAFKISLASHTGVVRDRFTVAHELGHYVLHFLWPNQNGKRTGAIMARRYGTGRVEWEANWFAAGFLMPEPAFRAAWKELRGSLHLVANRFEVSIEAASVRAGTFGLK